MQDGKYFSRRSFLISSALATASAIGPGSTRMAWLGLQSYHEPFLKMVREKLPEIQIDVLSVPLADAAELASDGTRRLTSDNELRLNSCEAVGIASRGYEEVAESAMLAAKPVYFLAEAVPSTHWIGRLSAVSFRNRVVFQCGFQHHGDPLYRKVRSWIRAGLIGEIKRAESWWNTAGVLANDTSLLARCLAPRVDAVRLLLDQKAPHSSAVSIRRYPRPEPENPFESISGDFSFTGEVDLNVVVSPGCQRIGFGELIYGSVGTAGVFSAERAFIDSYSAESGRFVAEISRGELGRQDPEIEDLKLFLKRSSGSARPQPRRIGSEAALVSESVHGASALTV